MKSKKNKFNIGHRRPLVKNLLLVDGIARAGKFLLANIINGLKGVEPVQYYGLLDHHIPFLEKSGLIEKETAKELLQCEIDTHCYEMLIGRNFNHRKSDMSSIFNNPRYKEYLKRCSEKDEKAAVKNFYKNKLYSFFIMHQLMPNIRIYFETFPKIKVISLQRSPLSLVFSWYRRRLASRFANDPRMFMIPFKSRQGLVPWFALNLKEYGSLSEVDRIILIMETLFKMYKDAYGRLPPCHRKKILFVAYEDILTNTDGVIRKISKFLGKKPLPEMKWILKKKKLPNANHGTSQEEKLEIIKKLASPKYFRRLMVLEKRYAGKI